MILTTTMNPSIDVSYPLEKLVIDSVNRVDEVSKTAGGKGLNVTRVLSQLDSSVKATGILGGHFGQFIKEKLDKENISHDFASIDGETRSSIAVLHEGNQTEILENGPEVSEKELDSFFKKYKQLLSEVELVTISGSLPQGINKNYYSTLIKEANRQSVKVLLDTSGESLSKAIEGTSKPFLIKPNEEEIGQLLGQKIDSLENVQKALNSDLFSNIEWVVVSLGEYGAIIKHKNNIYKVTIPKVEVINSVGSGDSTIAGLAHAIHDKESAEGIIKTGMVAGMLNTMNKKTGNIDMRHFSELYNKVLIQQL